MTQSRLWLNNGDPTVTTPLLYRVILPVSDIEVAAKFYGHVLGDLGERVSPGRHYFDCNGVVLACYSPTADGDDLGSGWAFPENQDLYLSVPDLEVVDQRIVGEGAQRIGLDLVEGNDLIRRVAFEIKDIRRVGFSGCEVWKLDLVKAVVVH